MLIKDCGLNSRTRNCLLRSGIKDINDLYEITERYGRRVLYEVCRNFGKVCMNDLLSNDITKYVMNHANDWFDKNKYDEDMAAKERKNSLESLRLLMRRELEINREIEEEIKNLGLDEGEVDEIYFEERTNYRNGKSFY